LHQIAGVKFGSIIALVKALGCPGIKDLSFKYNHRAYFTACLYALSSVFLTAQLAMVHGSPFFTLLCDSSTELCPLILKRTP
jgi:hypothetical protein